LFQNQAFSGMLSLALEKPRADVKSVTISSIKWLNLLILLDKDQHIRIGI